MSIHIGFADAVRGAIARGDINGWRHEGWRLNRSAFHAPYRSIERRILNVFIYGRPETTTQADVEAWRAANVMRDALKAAEPAIRSNRQHLRAGGML